MPAQDNFSQALWSLILLLWRKISLKIIICDKIRIIYEQH